MGGHALSLDQTTSISGHSIFVAHDAVIIDGTSTLPIPSSPTSGSNAAAFSGATTNAQQAAVTAGGHTITATRANDGNVLIGGTILSPGQVATISGTAVTAETSGVVVNGRTVFFLSTLTADSDSGSDSSSADVGAIFTLNGQTYTATEKHNANRQQYVVVDGKPLLPGGAAMTISDHTISDSPYGIVFDGTTHAFASLPFDPPALASKTIEAVLTLPDGKLVTAFQDTAADRHTFAVVNGSMISASGLPATVDGYTINNAPNGIVVKGTGLVDGVGWSTATGVAGAGLTGTGVVQGNGADRRGWRWYSE